MVKSDELKAIEKQDIWPVAQHKPLDLENLLDGIVNVHAKKGELTSKGGIIKIPDSCIKGPNDIQTAKDYFQKKGWDVDNVGGPSNGTYEFDIKPTP